MKENGVFFFMIDEKFLINQIKGYIDYNLWDEIDFDQLISKAEINNEEMTVTIKEEKFCFIFDLLNYELIDAIGT